MTGTAHRVVLTSLGRAGFAHLPVLRRLRPLPDARLAELLLQAPSELAVVDDRETAEQVGRLLDESGLATTVEPVTEEFTAGVGEYDVAVHVTDLGRVTAVIGEVAALLGVAPTAAREIVFATPPAFLGNISAATVDALVERFATIGAELSVSRRRDARFDLVVADCPPRTRAQFLDSMAGAGHQVADAAADHLLLLDVDEEEAAAVVKALARTSVEPTVLNRAFERFEVRIDGCPVSDEAAACLVDLTGMPTELAPRVAAQAPIVVLSDVGRSPMEDALGRLSEVGAEASAQLTTLMRCAVRIDAADDLAAVAATIEAVTGGALAPTRLPHLVEGPLGHLRARVLARELAAVGATAQVLVR